MHASLAQNLSPQQIYDTFYIEKMDMAFGFFPFLAFGIVDEFCCKTPRNYSNQMQSDIQLNLMELARKLKTRRQQRGQPCTNNTDNIWRESRMTSSRLHGQRTFRPNLVTSVDLVSLVCSTLTMHCDCIQYQQRAADFTP